MDHLLLVLFFALLNGHSAHRSALLSDLNHPNSTVVQDLEELLAVKLGIAAAFFTGVLVVCGLPVVILGCIQLRAAKRTIANSLPTHYCDNDNADGTRTASHSDSRLANGDVGPSVPTSRPSDLALHGANSNGASATEKNNFHSFEYEPVPTPLRFSPRQVETRALLLSQANTSPEERQTPSFDGFFASPSVPVHSHPQPLFNEVIVKRWLDRCNCFAAGIFLSTGFLDLYPEVQIAIEEAKVKLDLEIVFPIPPFITLLGFFFVLSIEQIVLTIKSRTGSVAVSIERPSCDYSLDRQLTQNTTDSSVSSSSASNPADPSVPVLDDGSDHGHSHLMADLDPNSLDSIASFIQVCLLISAMSIHSIFEGLAVGLQRTLRTTVKLFTAVLLHKIFITASIGISLASLTLGANKARQSSQQQANSTKRFVCQGIALFMFAASSPLGVLIGYALSRDQPSGTMLMTTGILQCIACGTFFFVVFCELLPEAFKHTASDRLVKLGFLIFGFLVFALYTYLMPE